VLTPEQQAQATKLRAERKARFEQRRQEFQQRQNQ
jgi:Spy/CpxP family protein refolding chaperone